MAVPIRFVKPADLRSTVRGLAIMSVLFGKEDCQFWTEPATGIDLGVWRDSSGNRCYFLFAPKGSILLGFDPASPMNEGGGPKPWPGVYDELPKELNELVRQISFDNQFKIEEVTFLIWNTGKGLDWKKGKIDYPKRESGDPDGSKLLLSKIREYYDHFEDAMEEEYETKCDPDALFVLFSGEPVGVEDLRNVKADLDVESVREPLRVIGITV